jgi:hypothetical protein
MDGAMCEVVPSSASRVAPVEWHVSTVLSFYVLQSYRQCFVRTWIFLLGTSSRPRAPLPRNPHSTEADPSVDHRSPMYSSDIRWLVVYKRLVMGLEGLSKHCQEAILNHFGQTGDVGGAASRAGGKKVMTAQQDRQLLDMVLDEPTTTLQGHSVSFLLQHGVKVHISSICRAMKRLQLTRQKVCRGSDGMRCSCT